MAGFAFRPQPLRQTSPVSTSYRLVRLRNGACSVHSLADDETFHPGIGPVAEAEALYIRQLRLPERVRETKEAFVLWDVGLGAAANALTTLRLVGESLDTRKSLRLVSFDRTGDALAFALQHSAELGYLAGFETSVTELLNKHSAKFSIGLLEVEWTLVLGDFPKIISGNSRGEEAHTKPEREPPHVGGHELPAPHAILFDPHSPAKNPAMWTAPLFAALFRRLDPGRPCALATFTRSTLARAALLLGGFFVGAGRATGLKEETTVAGNQPELLAEPLDRRWLDRARRSHSAEPLIGPVYRQEKLSAETWQRLQQHPQFQSDFRRA